MSVTLHEDVTVFYCCQLRNLRMRGAMSPLPHALWWRGACFSTRTNLLSRNVCIEVERKMAVLHVVSFESIS